MTHKSFYFEDLKSNKDSLNAVVDFYWKVKKKLNKPKLANVSEISALLLTNSASSCSQV